MTEDEIIPLLKTATAIWQVLILSQPRFWKPARTSRQSPATARVMTRVDLEAAQRLGVTVTYTPGANAEAVGELAFALILSVARSIPYLNAQTKSGAWVRSTGMELKGKTLGVAGLGAIGKVAARCAAGFGMNVAAYDPFINEAYCREHQIQVCSFEELLACSDVITLHLPLNQETYHFIDQKAISKMKDGVILINASRGGIIDEDAACEALSSGKIAGMGLDAFEQEPPTDSSRLLLSTT